jgi:hypothetical protein
LIPALNIGGAIKSGSQGSNFVLIFPFMLPSYKRKARIGLVVLLIAAAVAGVVFLRKRSAPQPARLLPDADAVLYIDFRLMRLETMFRHLSPVAHDPDYEQFVQATGFQFERDLDQAALALHASGSSQNPGIPSSGSLASHARFSEIFVGRFNGTKVSAYLQRLASSTQRYRETDIYNIPHEGRTVRVAILGLGTVAVSNVNDGQVIRNMIDNYLAEAKPLSGPSLVSDYYRHVPIGSVAWAIVKFAPSANRSLPLPGGFELAAQSLAGSVMVGSARYVGSLHLRIQDFNSTEQNARNLRETAETLLGLVRATGSPLQSGAADKEVKAFFDSVKLEQKGENVLLTATLPSEFIAKALSGPPVVPEEPAPAVQPEPKPSKQAKPRVSPAR